jgi:NADH dehydrogenase (ubiquinone) flavoprotein 2
MISNSKVQCYSHFTDNFGKLFFFFVKHRDTPENNPDTPFDFTPENYKVRLN